MRIDLDVAFRREERGLEARLHQPVTRVRLTRGDRVGNFVGDDAPESP